MRKIISIISSVFLIFEDAQSADINELEHKLERIEMDMQAVQKHIYSNNKITSPINFSREAAVSFEIRISELEEKMRELNGNLEEINHFYKESQTDNQKEADEIILLKGEILSLKDTVHTINTKLDEINNKVSQQVASARSENSFLAGKNQKTQLNSKITEDDYEKAMEFIKVAKFKEAEERLMKFVDENPSSKLAGNSYYWLGESTAAQNKHKEAAVHFLKGYTNYPNSNKAADSLYKLAISLEKIGKKSEACSAISKLEARFGKTNSELIEKSHEISVRVGCT